MRKKLHIDFRLANARALTFDTEFELAIMLCEGAFPLMETDEMNYDILKNAAKALVPGGKFIFTTLNGLFPLFHSLQSFFPAATTGTDAQYGKHTFDIMAFRGHNVTRFVDDDGQERELICNERYYVPSEITWLLKTLGFSSIGIFGARLGAFSRDHTLQTRDFEMLVIAEKPSSQ